MRSANEQIINSKAFDDFAKEYDARFTNTSLGRMLRQRVWKKLDKNYSDGDHVLEIACGTGEDAVYLAKCGVKITATDGSIEMIKIAQAKIEHAGFQDRIVAKQVSIQQIINGCFDEEFEGVFSNFGGLNTIGNWKDLAESIAKIVKPGGRVILVPMGHFCPWEIIWYLVHGDVKNAFRRFGKNVHAKIGASTIPVWYPSAGRLQKDFSSWFHHVSTESLGFWLPPAYLDHFVNKYPDFFIKLNKFEEETAHLTGGWGDHYICVFERK